MKQKILLLLLLFFVPLFSLFSQKEFYRSVPQGKTEREFRGVWVATTANLDFPKCFTFVEFCTEYRKILSVLKRRGINAVIFQVRPACDAFYPSAQNPWSRYMRGVEDMAYPKHEDPLQFMIAEAHRNGMEFHAWLNPYRVCAATANTKEQYLATLSRRNFARRYPETVLSIFRKDGKRTLFLDPGNPLTVRHFLQTVQEIVERYSPDAIHIDDYFYPYEGTGNADAVSCSKYKNAGMNIADWRRQNVNELIRRTSILIRENNRKQGKKILFGVSPFGIWMNRKNNPNGSNTNGYESCTGNYCDTLYWIRMRWINYVVPQIYWSMNYPKAPFGTVCSWWAQAVRGTGIRLYAGIALYQNPGANGDSEFVKECVCARQYPDVKGLCFYSFKNLNSPGTKVQKDAVRNMVTKSLNGSY